MSAHTITKMSRRMRQRRLRALALALGVCALAIPSAASAAPQVDAGSYGSSEATDGSGYRSPDSIVAVSDESAGRVELECRLRLQVSGLDRRRVRTARRRAHVRLKLAEQLRRRLRLGQRSGRRGCGAGARRAHRSGPADRAQAHHDHPVPLDELRGSALDSADGRGGRAMCSLRAHHRGFDPTEVRMYGRNGERRWL